eukprot:TRINITY_DN3022_c0_g1_i1.p1 TRINITY_DN3022_c0_g1~~TRINITY_DN3022_c0_g1_i1.p1  ORF type:complete len:268 (+),score=30.93 TRINITY_DN3022_c0_g1_i1:60-863(+)
MNKNKLLILSILICVLQGCVLADTISCEDTKCCFSLVDDVSYCGILYYNTFAETLSLKNTLSSEDTNSSVNLFPDQGYNCASDENIGTCVNPVWTSINSTVWSGNLAVVVLYDSIVYSANFSFAAFINQNPQEIKKKEKLRDGCSDFCPKNGKGCHCDRFQGCSCCQPGLPCFESFGLLSANSAKVSASTGDLLGTFWMSGFSFFSSTDTKETQTYCAPNPYNDPNETGCIRITKQSSSFSPFTGLLEFYSYEQPSNITTIGTLLLN